MAAILLSNVSLGLPGQAPLFTNVNLHFGQIRSGVVGRNGVGKSTLLNLIAGRFTSPSGYLSIEGTVALLSQSTALESHRTVAEVLGISDGLAKLQSIELGLESDCDFASVDWTLESRANASLDRVDMQIPLETPLAKLSGGQQTRVALAALIFAEPDFLLMDEPTNNLDRNGRRAVLDLLSGWRSGAIVVSHDRELLEIMDATVELTSISIKSYGGNWSEFQAIRALELAAAQREAEEANKRIKDISQTSQMRNERQARRSSAGKRAAAKGGMPRILLGGRKDNSEKTSGENRRIAGRMLEQATESVTRAQEKIEILKPFKIELASTNLHTHKSVVRLSQVRFGYDPLQPVVQDFSLSITGPERVAIEGRNGSGKSTVLSLITGTQLPWSGTVGVFTRSAMLDQSVSVLDPLLTIRDNYRQLNPLESENDCRAALARFLFRSEVALQTVGTLSGGQLVRAGLACLLGGRTPPPLLILDEPTNNLDLQSIETIESGLRAYDGALLIVSHDARFLDALQIDRVVRMP